jgi:periplasmic divalent cation tolerance protein
MSESKVVVVLTTTANEPEAARMSRALVEEGLAACAQRVPISSTYVWKGRVEESTEHLLILKTLADCCPEIERRIHALSSYEVPEVVTLEAVSVAAAYDSWLRSACRGRSRH